MENVKAWYIGENATCPVIIRQDGTDYDSSVVIVSIDWDRLDRDISDDEVYQKGLFDRLTQEVYGKVFDFRLQKHGVLEVDRTYLFDTFSRPIYKARKEDNTSRLVTKPQQLHEQLEEEGYSLVRVDHSIDMYEGTITLRYKKEEN